MNVLSSIKSSRLLEDLVQCVYHQWLRLPLDVLSCANESQTQRDLHSLLSIYVNLRQHLSNSIALDICTGAVSSERNQRSDPITQSIQYELGCAYTIFCRFWVNFMETCHVADQQMSKMLIGYIERIIQRKCPRGDDHASLLTKAVARCLSQHVLADDSKRTAVMSILRHLAECTLKVLCKDVEDIIRCFVDEFTVWRSELGFTGTHSFPPLDRGHFPSTRKLFHSRLTAFHEVCDGLRHQLHGLDTMPTEIEWILLKDLIISARDIYAGTRSSTPIMKKNPQKISPPYSGTNVSGIHRNNNSREHFQMKSVSTAEAVKRDQSNGDLHFVPSQHDDSRQGIRCDDDAAKIHIGKECEAANMPRDSTLISETISRHNKAHDHKFSFLDEANAGLVQTQLDMKVAVEDLQSLDRQIRRAKDHLNSLLHEREKCCLKVENANINLKLQIKRIHDLHQDFNSTLHETISTPSPSLDHPVPHTNATTIA